MQFSPFEFESLVPVASGSKMDIFRTLPDEAAPAEAEEPAPPPPPTFSEAELEAAKKKAYDEGFEAGKKEGLREVDMEARQQQELLQQSLEKVNAVLPGVEQEHRHYLAEQLPELGKLIIASAEKLALEALRKEPLADIESMIRECIGLLITTPELTVKVHPQLQHPLQKRIGGAARVMGDDSITPGDCRIHWNQGEAKRDLEAIWEQVSLVIDRHFTTAAAAAKAADKPRHAEGEDNG